ncbi:MAG: anthranilate synthase component I family protein [Candidatus Peribacteraceae bacterium]|nr:anthranilate synthase component I family protein [Candidatus Peribacteraceae bacterium]
MNFPLTSLILRPEHCDPLFLLRELGRGREYCALLESVDRQGTNDYSFVALGARDVITVQNGRVSGSRYVPDGAVSDPLSVFKTIVGTGEEGGRLKMGYIGFLSYESARCFEQIDLEPDPSIPDAMFVLPEVLLRIDHEQHEVTVTMHADSDEDVDHIRNAVLSSPFFDDRKGRSMSAQTEPVPSRAEGTSELIIEEISPLRQTPRNEFIASAQKIQESIRSGEAFQVVLSQELVMENDVPPERVYAELRRINPSPYMYCFKTPERTIVGASPETLIRVDCRNIFYRPIAGTRKRTGDVETDTQMQQELLHDEKERCEHQMLVDLGRNDVGRVAEIGTVKVRNPFHIEQYAHVYHIVSDIVARLRTGLTPMDALRAVFPAGTLTGAPKVRAMEIIRDTEKSPRGIYGGAFGYIDLRGNLDFAITIRTMLFQDDKITLRVGAGIVDGSIPEREDDECLHKARSCLAAVTLATASLVAS